MFDSLVLTLTDATDVGAIMRITVGVNTYLFSGLSDANKQTVRIDFDQAIDTASIFFGNWRNGAPRLNDGFSIDDIAVSEVPLPASSLLLLAGLAGLASTRRKSA